MNKVFLIGNLTRDPELTTTSSGIAVAKFGIAVNRAYSSNAQGEREVDFFNIVCWRGLAENCAKFLKKGKKMAVSGRIEIRNYEDKDGNKRTSIDIVADDVEFLSPIEGGSGYTGNSNYDNNNRAQSPSQSSYKKPVSELTPVEDDGDLPF